MSHPRIELFGTFRLIVDGRCIPLSTSQKAGVLLAYLACRAGHETSREVLIEALWPECEPENGRTRLRTVLSDLRKLLAENGLPETEVLAASRGRVSLDGGLVATDVADFQRLISHGRDMRTERILKLESALKLYKGELLPGFYEEWAHVPRGSLAKSRADAINELAGLYESEGQPDRAAATLLPLIHEDPLNEDAHCEVMRLQIASGRRSAALKQYADLTRILKDELDTVPSSDAQSLAAIARSKPQDRQTGVDAQAVPAQRPQAVSESAAVIRGIESRAAFSPSRWNWIPAAFIALGVLAASVAGSQFPRRQSEPNHLSVTAPVSTPYKEPAWVYRYEPKEGDKGSDSRTIAVDRNGSVYIAGFVETEKTDTDFLVVKLDRNGKEAWPEPFRYNGPGNDVDRIYDIEVDDWGNIYVTGDSDNGTNESKWTRLDSNDFCTIKIGPDGQPSQTWPDTGYGIGVRRYDGPDNGEDMPKQIVLDKAGSAYVLGYSYSRTGGKDIAVVRYDRNGRQVWANRFDGPTRDEDIASSMSLDGEGGLYVTGSSRGGPKDAPERDMVVIKYRASNGEKMWNTRWGANNQFDDSGVGVTLDHEYAHVYGIGRTRAGTFNNERPGLILMALEARSGRVIAVRGAKAATDHLDRVDSASLSRYAGDFEGQTRVVYRDFSRSELQNAQPNLTGSSIVHGMVGMYIIGTSQIAAAPDQTAIPKIRTTGQSCDWVFPGPGGLPHTSRAAAVWLQPEGSTHVRQWVIIAGQYDTGDSPHMMALSYNAQVVELAPNMRGFRN